MMRWVLSSFCFELALHNTIVLGSTGPPSNDPIRQARVGSVGKRLGPVLLELLKREAFYAHKVD